MMNYWKSYEKKRKKENGWLLLVMRRGVELKLMCTKYLKKIQACITQEFKSEISKRKISRTHMNKISTTMNKTFREHTWSTTFQKHLFPKIRKQFTRGKSQDHTWAKFHKLAMSLQNFARKITMGKIKGNNFVTIRNGVKGIGMELLRVAIDIVEIKGILHTRKLALWIGGKRLNLLL